MYKENAVYNYQERKDVVNSLNDDLWTLLKPDEEIRQLAIREKEKLRNLKDNFNNHYTELKSLEESFTLVFNAI